MCIKDSLRAAYLVFGKSEHLLYMGNSSGTPLHKFILINKIQKKIVETTIHNKSSLQIVSIHNSAILSGLPHIYYIVIES